MLAPCILLHHFRVEVGRRWPSALAGFYSAAAAKCRRFSGLLCHRRKQVVMGVCGSFLSLNSLTRRLNNLRRSRKHFHYQGLNRFACNWL